MLWEVEIQPIGRDREREREQKDAERLMTELLVDPLVEIGRITQLAALNSKPEPGSQSVTVLLKPGVMDPAAMSVVDAAHDLGMAVDSVRTFRRYYFVPPYSGSGTEYSVLEKVLANDAIEQIVPGPITAEHLALGAPCRFRLITVPLRDLDDTALMR